jgi:hypothetical protein
MAFYDTFKLFSHLPKFITLQELAPYQVLHLPVAGHHRASPSASLDKRFYYIKLLSL